MTPDPYEALSVALRDVIAGAVADGVARALASVSTPGGEVMVDIPEAAQRLGLGITKCKQLISAGELPSRVVGRRRLVRVVDLGAFAS